MSNTHSLIIYFVIIISDAALSRIWSLSLASFPVKILYGILASPTRETCPDRVTVSETAILLLKENLRSSSSNLHLFMIEYFHLLVCFYTVEIHVSPAR